MKNKEKILQLFDNASAGVIVAVAASTAKPSYMALAWATSAALAVGKTLYDISRPIMPHKKELH